MNDIFKKVGISISIALIDTNHTYDDNISVRKAFYIYIYVLTRVLRNLQFSFLKGAKITI